MRLWLVILGLACAPAYAQDEDTQRHLLAGVQAFREGRYDEALVELRVVERAPDAPDDLAFYLGPTLVKLDRDREALGVFLRSRAPRDGLTDFYFGEAYYHLRLYRKAREVFAGLRAHGLGPVLDEAAGRYISAVDAVYVDSVSPTTVDYYAAHARDESQDPLIAAEFWDEARLADDFVSGKPRQSELVAALANALNDSGRAPRVIDLLAARNDRAPDELWQLARAYTAVDDPSHAVPLLHMIVRAHAPHSADATRLLATLHVPP